MTKQAAQFHQERRHKVGHLSKLACKRPTEQLFRVTLQNQIGNRTIQRLLAQRSDLAPAELDDTTADRINSARGGGQSLDTTIQQKMGEAMGSDFSGVRVHTGSESHELNEQLGARAFTTGQDVFFRDGEYNPSSSGGQELLAHELTHVVQQGSGAVGGGSGKMAVNAPGDQFEQEADAVAKQVTSAHSASGAPAIQRESMPEEEEVQAKHLQREAAPEEEELQAKHIQREAMPEEEDLQAKFVQREGAASEEAPEEEEMAQMQEMPAEEEEMAAG